MNLENCEQGARDRVEVGRRPAFRKVEGASEDLHAEQREDEDEQEEKEQKGHDGRDGVHEGDHKISQARPVPANKSDYTLQCGMQVPMQVF